MKIFIAGGSGRVAAATIEKLTEKGHEVYAGSRHVEAIIKGDHIHPVPFDLHADAATMAKQIAGMDAVYFLAGSRGKDLLQTDAFGAVKLMQACEKAGVKRYIQLSSIFALKPEKWQDESSLSSIINYDIAKFFADEWLVRNTDLNYTIIGPSVLKEEEGTGKIQVNPSRAGENPIPDVAVVLAAVLDKVNTYQKVIEMSGGETPIEEALDQL